MSDQVRVRFAPSPTGHLHIGSARTALFNFLLARKSDGKFIVRIEDTDQARNVENGEEKLLKGLKWLGINWDESVDVGGEFGPYRSMDRLDIYEKYVNQLIEQGQAYHCYCTPEEIEAERQSQLDKGETPKYSGKCRYLSPEQKERLEKEGRKPSIRFRVPEGKILKVDDAIRGKVVFESDGIGDFVIVRPDGIPTYNFAVTIDDYLMKITHVIRGEEHLSNTPRQLLIYQAMNWQAPQFAHIPLILNQDRKKMSKRDESIIQFVEQYKELGFLPEAILNFIALLGWSPEGEEEIFTLDELISQFSLERVAKSPAVFDIQKLYWMNNHYIKSAPLERVVELCLPHLQKAGYVSETLNEEDEIWVKTLVGLYQEQLNYGQEIIELAKMFFEDEFQMNEEGKAILTEEHIPIVMEEFKNLLGALDEYTPETIKGALKTVQKVTGYKGKQLFMPIRVATTGATHGRDLPETLFLLGKEKVLMRLDQLLTRR
ncbi:glutamate--tRNA ligase [Tepidibacillus fermentans]|uniref:Glutamate--tRNA ligase n=1 Tax=Tepidibacillus fermentans TaxID=1281767 RepID=A0A4R3KFZ7_9BACI|nr:glutamate--tRNA ligase [Tepidibacillus fermentans]TCS81571.1 glutamyl-tRNA synthetase /glutamate--tRNA(Gln) ligase [Tepidibacillus fermentans]